MIGKWDHRMIRLAKEISSWSKDPSTKCGCVISTGSPRNIIVSTGYNGFPHRVLDRPTLYENRSHKYNLVVHAETNAIITAERDRLVGATLYCWPLPVCCECAKLVAQAGIQRVVTPVASADANERWGNSISWAYHIFYEAGVIYEPYFGEASEAS